MKTGTGVPDPEELVWQADWSFGGTRNRKLVLDHRVSWHWDSDMRKTMQEGRVEYRWRTPSKDVLHLPLVNRAIPKQHHLENTERIGVRGLYPWSDAPAETISDLGFLLHHESHGCSRIPGISRAGSLWVSAAGTESSSTVGSWEWRPSSGSKPDIHRIKHKKRPAPEASAFFYLTILATTQGFIGQLEDRFDRD
jgi:hypothetical protein